MLRKVSRGGFLQQVAHKDDGDDDDNDYDVDHDNDGDNYDVDEDLEDNRRPLPASAIEVVARVREITVF